MRKVVISAHVQRKIEELNDYLTRGYGMSQGAADEHSRRMEAFVNSLTLNADYALCRFKRWRELGYRCVVFEKGWVFAYETFEQGVVVRDMCRTAMLKD